jgi:hypothetical protein
LKLVKVLPVERTGSVQCREFFQMFRVHILVLARRRLEASGGQFNLSRSAIIYTVPVRLLAGAFRGVFWL